MNTFSIKRKWMALFLSTSWAVVLLVVLNSASLGGAQAGEGEVVYKSNCSICHGSDGSGNTAIGKRSKLPDLRSAEVQQQSDPQLTDTLAKGKGKMKPFKDRLTPEQIQQAVGYLRELAKHR
jgi:cytochrome c6